MTYKTVKLGDICDLANGYAFKSEDYVENSNTMNCRMSNIRPGGQFDIDYNPKFLPDDFADKYKQFLLKDGDVVIAMTDLANSPKILGVPTIVKTKGRNILLNQRVGKLVIRDKEKVHFPYLKLVLNYPKTRTVYKKYAGGGLQINLGKADLLSVRIPLPPLDEQKRIAAVLDKADEVRAKRRAALEKLDSLLQSVFLDMFGDPVSNPKGLDKVSLISIVSKEKGSIMRGPFGGAIKKEIFVPDGFKIYEQKNAINNDFSLGSYFIDESKFNELITFSVKPDDLIISCSGTVGKIAIAPKDAKAGIINQALMKIRVDKKQIYPLYLKFLLETESLQSDIFGSARGVAIKNVKPLSEVKETSIPLPKLEEQKMFIDYSIKFEQARKSVLESYEKVNNLFQSLQQRAFAGELFGAAEIEEAMRKPARQ